MLSFEEDALRFLQDPAHVAVVCRGVCALIDDQAKALRDMAAHVELDVYRRQLERWQRRIEEHVSPLRLALRIAAPKLPDPAAVNRVIEYLGQLNAAWKKMDHPQAINIRPLYGVTVGVCTELILWESKCAVAAVADADGSGKSGNEQALLPEPPDKNEYTEESRPCHEWCAILARMNRGVKLSKPTFYNWKKGAPPKIRAILVEGQKWRLHIDDLPDGTKSKPQRAKIVADHKAGTSDSPE